MIANKFEEQIFFITTKITINDSLIWTGFLVQAPLDDWSQKWVLLLISNKHVFDNPQGKIEFNFNRKKEDESVDLGNIHTFSGKDFSAIYTEHPDKNVDLACINASIIAPQKIYYKNITMDAFADFNEELLIPWADVRFIWYPENRFDQVNNLPLLRKGYIASLPKIDFNDQKQFVIDAQVFPGSSGSPVFTKINNQFRFIGVITQTMIKHWKLETIQTVNTGIWIQQILGLWLVIKSAQVKELIQIVIDKIKEIKSEPKII